MVGSQGLNSKDSNGFLLCAVVLSIAALVLCGLALGFPWAVRDMSAVSRNRMNGDLSLSLHSICNWNVTGEGKYGGVLNCIGLYDGACSFCDVDCTYSTETIDDVSNRKAICNQCLAVIIFVALGAGVSVAIQRVGWVYTTLDGYSRRVNCCDKLFGCRCNYLTQLFGEDFSRRSYDMSRRRKRCISVLAILQSCTWLPPIFIFIDTLKRFNAYQQSVCASAYMPSSPPWSELMCFMNSESLKLEAGWSMVLSAYFVMLLALACLAAYLFQWDRKTGLRSGITLPSAPYPDMPTGIQMMPVQPVAVDEAPVDVPFKSVAAAGNIDATSVATADGVAKKG